MTNVAITPADLDRLEEFVPEKPARFLAKALRRGLTVRQHTNTSVTGGLGWTIESPNPIDDWQLWLYFQGGSRGGTLTISRYTPSTTRKSNTTKLTQQMAGVTIDDMGDALDRHNARIAEAEAAMRQVGAELDGATVTLPGVVPVSGDVSLAKEALAALKANGKFAIRAAARGTIPRNTPAKVRHALVRRGLAQVSGGALTDLGKAVRSLITA